MIRIYLNVDGYKVAWQDIDDDILLNPGWRTSWIRLQSDYAHDPYNLWNEVTIGAERDPHPRPRDYSNVRGDNAVDLYIGALFGANPGVIGELRK